MNNVFIHLIRKGRIRNTDELKKVFRKLAKLTHPDSAGSDRFTSRFIEYKKMYAEAEKYLAESEEPVFHDENYRFLFYQELFHRESLEADLSKRDADRERSINQSSEKLKEYFNQWDPKHFKLFLQAENEYDSVKKEIQKNSLKNLRKPTLYRYLKPFIFNLLNYHLTGKSLYLRQFNRIKTDALKKLEDEKYFRLKDFLELLMKTLPNGP